MSTETNRGKKKLALAVASPLLVALLGTASPAFAKGMPVTPQTALAVQTAITQSDLASALSMGVTQKDDAIAEAVQQTKCALYDNGSTHCALYSDGAAAGTNAAFVDPQAGQFIV